MIYDMNAPAKAVKGRASSRKKVSYFEPPAFESVQKPVAAARQTSATAVGQAAAQVTGGKARKTGMLLARAKLGTATSEVAATRDRQSTLLSKGRYRDAELTAREAPTGTLNILYSTGETHPEKSKFKPKKCLALQLGTPCFA